MVARWYLCAECGGTWPTSAVVVVIVVVAVMDMVIFRAIFFELLVFFTFTLLTLHSVC